MPVPSIITSTVPSGAKLVSVFGISSSSRRRFASASSEVATTSLPVAGLRADQPAAAPHTDTATNTAMKATKSVVGSGKRFPARSMASRADFPKDICTPRADEERPKVSQITPIPSREVSPG